MAEETGAKTLDEATKTPREGARFWLDQIHLADRTEKDWRIKADDIVERYRDEKRRGGTRLNIFWANVQLLKPSVYSQRPSPDVRRRNTREDESIEQTGREVARVLERNLEYSIDDGFDRVMKAVRDDMLIPGRGVARVTYDPEIVERRDIEVVGEGTVLEPKDTKADAEYSPRHPVENERCRRCVNFRPPGECTAVRGGINPTGHCHRYFSPATFVLDGEPAFPDFDDEGYPVVEEVADERIATRYVFWGDFRMSPARNWEGVWWVAFRHAMTKDQLEEEFEDAARDIKLTLASEAKGKSEERDDKSPADPENAFDRAEVWEIWNKLERERVWVAKGHDKVIRTDSDPLRLKDFFPMPPPLTAVETTDTMVPLPEFCLYQDQANELDILQERIARLVEIAKAVSVIDGDFQESTEIKNAKDGAMIPVKRPDVTATDLNGSIWDWPIGNVVAAIQTLTMRADAVKNQIFEITGLSDLSRGIAKPRVTAAAELATSRFGAVRMTPRSEPMEKFIRDLLRIQAEIMAEMFDPATLERASGIQVTPAMVDLMRRERIRNTAIDVETDSTVLPDSQVDKQEAIEFTGAVTQYLQAASQLAAGAPALTPFLVELLRAAMRPFKFSRKVEESLDRSADAVMAQAQQAQAAQNAPQQGQAAPQQGNGALPANVTRMQ